MDVLELDGQRYTRRGKKWADEDGMVACYIIQDKLNRLFNETLDYNAMPFDELLKTGDQYKETHSLGLAVRCYRVAFEKADMYGIKLILPRLTSCFRQMGRPQDAIEVLTEAAGRFGSCVMSVPLYTSAAAAYCDMGQYRLARKACNRAFVLSKVLSKDGRIDGELKAVFGRIRKEAPEVMDD